MSQKRFISVILPLKLEWEPCYLINPEAKAEARAEQEMGTEAKEGLEIRIGQEAEVEVKVGQRVRVKFAGKEHIGVISATDIVPDIDISKVQPIMNVESGIEDVLPEEIEYWRRMAGYYLCTVGEVYKAAYPTGKVHLEEARAEAKRKAVERKERIVTDIRRRIARLQERLSKKEELLKRANEKVGSTKGGGKLEGNGTKGGRKLEEDITKIVGDIDKANIALASAHKNVEAAYNTLNLNDIELPECSVKLTPAQEEAYSQIQKGFQIQKPVLLHGVTSSGKTEIYIKAAYEAMSKGRNVLYLVPEIALSRQLEERLYKHFSDRLLVFHSGESAAAKRNTAEIIRSQRGTKGNYILLGTRSSLFLPHHDLGLIIVDEEHDNSYKQDSPAPRYNGRDSALILFTLQNSVKHNCNILLGSATPSLEETYNCLTNKHFKVTLNERFHGSEGTEVEIIDTKAERRKNGMIGHFSRILIGHINKTISGGGQVLILRSRRAWATALQCENCGEIQKCPNCNVSLSLHKTNGRQVCHYCGYSRPDTGNCTKCSGKLLPLGAGTQKIEEEAVKLFPTARIARLDSDITQNQAYEKQTIQAFAKGEIDILIGTQIVTKGFDFGNLNLVAVISADSLLGLQDFRADEKALQLLEQFRGRCARRSDKGLFVIQTSQPEHPIYEKILTNDATGFSTSLLEERKHFNFPPFSRIIEISIRDKNEKRAYMMSHKLLEALQTLFSTNMLTGPYQPAVDKIDQEHIRKIRINLKKDRHLSEHKHALATIVWKMERECRYTGHISINVDPS